MYNEYVNYTIWNVSRWFGERSVETCYSYRLIDQLSGLTLIRVRRPN